MNATIMENEMLTMNELPKNSEVINFEVIENLFNYCNSYQDTDSQKLIARLLIDATHKRFQTGLVHEHIYLKNDEVPQIQLFNILIEKFPFVKYSQIITNQAIIDTIGEAADVCLMDIGIGQGAQMLNVIEAAKKLSSLKRLHIIGIEPFGDALHMAEERINAMKSQVHFDIEFTGVHGFAEEIDFESFKGCADHLIVNASLALHHIQDADARLKVIAAIKQLNPKAFILIEPNVDHFEVDFAKRFMNCYHHYYNLFMVIDRLDITAKDKNALKLFFGREIDDVIGKVEKERYEKHEKADRWIGRLKACGFTMNETMLKSPVEQEAGVVIRYHEEGFLGFTHQTETVLAVMYAQ
ncbi:MAG: hypothetical protein JNJ58_05125 [Chitinophagaceae bacterium]|nr:hypothetical protein [Chitinophagaceae bacterium]